MLWQTIIEKFPFLVEGLLRSGAIFLAMLGVVYIFGRMLAILKSDRARNGIAILTAFPVSWWLARIYDVKYAVNVELLWWRIIIHALVACVLFVLIGWKLFDRVDHFFDKKFAEAEAQPKPKRRKKT